MKQLVDKPRAKEKKMCGFAWGLEGTMQAQSELALDSSS